MNSYETIGQRLRRLRLERGLSQRMLSDEGVSYAYVSRIEAGTRDPSVKAIRILAAKLGVSPEYLEFGLEITTTDSVGRDLYERSGGKSVLVRFHPGGVCVSWGARQRSGATLTEALAHAVAAERETGRLRAEADRLRADLAEAIARLKAEREAERELACS